MRVCFLWSSGSLSQITACYGFSKNLSEGHECRCLDTVAGKVNESESDQTWQGIARFLQIRLALTNEWWRAPCTLR